VSNNWSEDPRLPVPPLDAATILRTLIAHDVDFLVIGGLAVAAHGFSRGTKDVDVVPAPDSSNRRRLFAALEELRARPLEIGDFRAEEMPVPFTPDGLEEGGNWALTTRAGRVDVMQWVPGIENGYESLSANAIDDEVPAVGRVRFAGYDDVVTMKRTAGRPLDLADLHELEQVRGEPEP
jgi:hypothetical protein